MAKKVSAAVVVVGEIGKNPRMQYHTISLADSKLTGYDKVDIVGYDGPPPCKQVLENSNIRKRYIPTSTTATKPIKQGISKFLFLFFAAIKLLVQSWHLFMSLLSIPKPTFILVQTPPAMPTLFVVWLVCRLRGCKFAIDWHNFAFTLVRLSRGDGILVSVSRTYEKFFGRRGDIHFCVTDAMRIVLKDEWGINATVLHDHPPKFFKRCTLEETHDLFVRLQCDILKDKLETPTPEKGTIEQTLITRKLSDGKIELLENRPAIIMSSTSWTADEDFSILLKALEICETELKTGTDIVCFITGKGPLRAFYEEQIASLGLKKIKIITAFLPADDYPKLLGSSNLGVSLHSSSSKVDLPMKVVDMFGSNLPVCALGFECLNELVVDGKNGLIFNNSNELAKQIHELLNNFPKNTQKLDNLRKEAKMTPWDDEWNKQALPVLSAGQFGPNNKKKK